MKILYLIAENLPTDRVDVACLFGKYLPQYGINSDLVTGVVSGVVKGEGAELATNDSSGVELEQPNESKALWQGGKAIVCTVSDAGLVKNIKKFVHAMGVVLTTKKNSYDAVQVRDMPILAALILFVARLKGLKFCYWMSYPITEGQAKRAKLYINGGLNHKLKATPLFFRSTLGWQLLYKWVLPRCHHVFVQSDEMQKRVEQQNIPKSKMTVVPMCVDIAAVDSRVISPYRDVALEEKKLLVYIGTLNPEREIEKLIEMMPLVNKVRDDVVLLLVGGCAEQSNFLKLQSLAQALGLEDSIVFTGWQPMNKAWEYVKAADIGLSPIPRGQLLDVGSPTKVMEYLALGLPVVANDNPDQYQVLEASGAGVCVPYTSENFAAATLKLLDESKAERAQRTSNGYAYVKQHRDYQVLAAKLAKRYREILNNEA